MRSADGGNRRWYGGLPPVTALAVKYILSIMGGILTLTAFITLITAKPVGAFVRKHPYPIYLAFILTVLMLLATLNYTQALRKRNAELKAAQAHPGSSLPSGHDVRFFADALSDVPVDGQVIAWLRRVRIAELKPREFPADVLSALQKTSARPRTRPVGFDNQDIANALQTFLEAIDDFCAAVEAWTLVYYTARWQDAASNNAAEDQEAGTSVLEVSHAELIRAYDAFIITAHSHGVDADTSR